MDNIDHPTGSLKLKAPLSAPALAHPHRRVGANGGAITSASRLDRLFPEDLAHLRASGLDDETIISAGWYSLRSPQEVASALGLRFWAPGGGGIAIPVYQPGENEPDHIRVRPHRPRTHDRNGKPRPAKYEGPFDARPVYFSPRALAGQWGCEIAFVEGEKKALCLDQLGFATVGIIGCWGAHDAPHHKATKEWRLHPWISEHVPLQGCSMLVVADSDARTSRNVRGGLHWLVTMLRDAGAAVQVVRVPAGPDDAKEGIDDFFVREGAEATQSFLATREAADEPLDPGAQLVLTKHRSVSTDVRIEMDLPPDGEPIVLYASRNMQVPVFRYWPLPDLLMGLRIKGPTKTKMLGAAKKLLLARIARLADDDGCAKPTRGHYYEDGSAYLGARGLARAIGKPSHTSVLDHLSGLQQGGVIHREHHCGNPRLPDSITISPGTWHLWNGTTVWSAEDLRHDAPPELIHHLAIQHLLVQPVSGHRVYTMDGREYDSLRAILEAVREDAAWKQRLLDRLLSPEGIPNGEYPFRWKPDRGHVERKPILHVPEALAATGLVPHQAVLVYTRIVYHNGSKGPRPLDMKDLAESVGLSSSDGLRRYIKKLKDARLIEPRQGHSGKLFVPLMHPWLRLPGALRKGKRPRPWSDSETSPPCSSPRRSRGA